MATTITITIGETDPLVFEDVQNVEITESVVRLTRTISTTNVINGVEVANYGHAETAMDVLDLVFITDDYTITIAKVGG